MSKPRDEVKMSAAEIQEFLASNNKVQLASLGADGHPHLTTLFYALDEQGRITFWTYGTSQKVVNVRRDPRVSVLVEDGTDYDQLRGVTITGTAVVVDDSDAVREIGKAVVCGMYGFEDYDALGEEAAAGLERQVAKRVGIVINPDHIASWDHRKMKG